MVTYCVAYNCRNKAGQGFSLHKFPLKDELLCKAWCNAVRREDFKPTKYSVLCAKHFKPEDFEPYVSGYPKLRPGSIPTVFDFPPNVGPTPVKKRKSPVKRKETSACSSSATDSSVNIGNPTTSTAVKAHVSSGASRKQKIYKIMANEGKKGAFIPAPGPLREDFHEVFKPHIKQELPEESALCVRDEPSLSKSAPTPKLETVIKKEDTEEPLKLNKGAFYVEDSIDIEESFVNDYDVNSINNLTTKKKIKVEKNENEISSIKPAVISAAPKSSVVKQEPLPSDDDDIAIIEEICQPKVKAELVNLDEDGDSTVPNSPEVPSSPNPGVIPPEDVSKLLVGAKNKLETQIKESSSIPTEATTPIKSEKISPQSKRQKLSHSPSNSVVKTEPVDKVLTSSTCVKNTTLECQRSSVECQSDSVGQSTPTLLPFLHLNYKINVEELRKLLLSLNWMHVKNIEKLDEVQKSEKYFASRETPASCLSVFNSKKIKLKNLTNDEDIPPEVFAVNSGHSGVSNNLVQQYFRQETFLSLNKKDSPTSLSKYTHSETNFPSNKKTSSPYSERPKEVPMDISSNLSPSNKAPEIKLPQASTNSVFGLFDDRTTGMSTGPLEKTNLPELVSTSPAPALYSFHASQILKNPSPVPPVETILPALTLPQRSISRADSTNLERHLARETVLSAVVSPPPSIESTFSSSDDSAVVNVLAAVPKDAITENNQPSMNQSNVSLTTDVLRDMLRNVSNLTPENNGGNSIPTKKRPYEVESDQREPGKGPKKINFQEYLKKRANSTKGTASTSTQFLSGHVPLSSQTSLPGIDVSPIQSPNSTQVDHSTKRRANSTKGTATTSTQFLSGHVPLTSQTSLPGIDVSPIQSPNCTQVDHSPSNRDIPTTPNLSVLNSNSSIVTGQNVPGPEAMVSNNVHPHYPYSTMFNPYSVPAAYFMVPQHPTYPVLAQNLNSSAIHYSVPHMTQGQAYIAGLPHPVVSSSHGLQPNIGPPFRSPFEPTENALLEASRQSGKSSPTQLTVMKRFKSLAPQTVFSKLGNDYFHQQEVHLFILTWSIHQMSDCYRDKKNPPFGNKLIKVSKTYHSGKEHYNTYLPSLLWELFHRAFSQMKTDRPFTCCKFVAWKKGGVVGVVSCILSDSENRGEFVENDLVFLRICEQDITTKMLGYVACIKRNSHGGGCKVYFQTAFERCSSTELKRVEVLGLCPAKWFFDQHAALKKFHSSPLANQIFNPRLYPARCLTLSSVDSQLRKIAEGIRCNRDLPKESGKKPSVVLLCTSDLVSTVQKVVKLVTLLKEKVFLLVKTEQALVEVGLALLAQSCSIWTITSPAVKRKLPKELTDRDLFDHGGPLSTIHCVINDAMCLLAMTSHCYFDHLKDPLDKYTCIIMEANSCTEPESLVPLLYEIPELILVGDPNVQCQTCSRKLAETNHGWSLFYRLHATCYE